MLGLFFTRRAAIGKCLRPRQTVCMQKAKNCTASHKERGTQSESKTSRVPHISSPPSLFQTLHLQKYSGAPYASPTDVTMVP